MTDDDRHEKYAKEMFERQGYRPTWAEVLASGRSFYIDMYRGLAESAIVVADGELASQKHDLGEEWAKEYADAARLREEIAELDKACNDLDRENARLREELAATVRAKQENDERFQLRAAEAEAVVDRVKAVLDDPNVTALDIWWAVRAALEGETDD